MSAIKNAGFILASTVWVSICEFSRNQLWLQSYWVEHYAKMGQTFPSQPINGAMWGVWALLFSIVVFIITRRFTWLQSAAIGWLLAFPMMWVVIGNLGVLPFGTLPIAIPFSIVEATGVAFIVSRSAGNNA